MELPDELIVATCKKMDISQLINFIQTSKLNYDLCQPILIRKIKQNISKHYDDYLDQIYTYLDNQDVDNLRVYLDGLNRASPKLLKRMINKFDEQSPMFYILDLLNKDEVYVDMMKLLIEYGGNVEPLVNYVYKEEEYELILYFNDLIKKAGIKVRIPQIDDENFIQFVSKGLEDDIFNIPSNIKNLEKFYKELYEYYNDIYESKRRLYGVEEILSNIQNILTYL